MDKLTVFVGCALHDVPEDYLKEIGALKEELRKDFIVLDCLDLKDERPRDMYQKDIQGYVAMCDLFVALCDHPATGLGYELATAIEKYSKPTLAAAREGASVSPLVLGVEHPMYSFSRYVKMADILPFVKEKAKKFYPEPALGEACETDVCAV